MTSSMLSFVIDHLPDNWEDTYYTSSYASFTLDKYSREYQNIEEYFKEMPVYCIKRVQNPYQYGRFMLRREMLKTNYEEIVFHIIHRDNLTSALQFNCDPRRYDRLSALSENGKNPKFYQSLSSNLKKSMYPITNYMVLVVKCFTIVVETQADYYIQYVVEF